MSDRYFIMYMDDNFKVHEFEFKKNIVDHVAEFVVNSHWDIIEQCNCNDEEIIVCIPNYLLDYIQKQHIKLVNSETKVLGDIYFCGLKVQMSYENSITVFYNAYIPNQIIKYTLEL